MKGEPKPLVKKLTPKEALALREKEKLDEFEKRIHINLSTFTDKPENDDLWGNS